MGLQDSWKKITEASRSVPTCRTGFPKCFSVRRPSRAFRLGFDLMELELLDSWFVFHWSIEDSCQAFFSLHGCTDFLNSFSEKCPSRSFRLGLDLMELQDSWTLFHWSIEVSYCPALSPHERSDLLKWFSVKHESQAIGPGFDLIRLQDSRTVFHWSIRVSSNL